MAHHKSNKAVEGNPDTGHGGGLPRRPDEEELDERTEADRELVGLAPGDSGSEVDPAEQHADEEAEVDRQVAHGDIATDAGLPRSERDPFPPTGYED
ncbi:MULTISPECIES: hypothetical protein [Streptacidiphilus]|uniref:DUF5709 domain-containing protein n=1 Tax=Streptacidiphilus cavernicola TaxID=3342716 RepID=A0ABV6UMB3_9ACTN|nr:hypothetical protein [Streptacidiphilus jeojiense]